MHAAMPICVAIRITSWKTSEGEENKMTEQVVIIGGCAAGMSAASRARRTNPNLDIVVYERTGFVAYGACGLPYYVSGLVEDHNTLVVRTPEQFARQGIKVHLHHEVTDIDTENRRVRVTDLGHGETRQEAYDKLVIATGGRAATPANAPGFSSGELSGVFVVRTVEDGVSIRDFVQRERPQRAVIVGAGYIGLEMAESFCLLGLDTTVIGRPPQILKRFDPEMARFMQDKLEDQGVRLSLGDEVKALEGDSQGRVRRVVSSTGTFEADLVLLALGVLPNVALAEAAGVTLGETGAIATDSGMRTNLPDVFSAGDCAEAYHRVTGRGAYIPLGTTANKQGRVMGTNVGGGDATFEGIVGTTITKAFDTYAALTGLADKEARALGYNVKSTTIKARSRAHYYPGGAPMHVKLTVEEESGRLLGGQIIGDEGAGLRINVLAGALHSEMTVERLSQLDLAYMPSMSPVWDPLLVAANVALKD
jgi:NADPH-dependent 2,4-dienoyl-CoA reductase/sulfur reductase-like enzyme